jgi:adenosine deaminase
MSSPEGLAELHTHLGGAVASEIMWTLAHEQGIALPVKDYWEFDQLVTVSDPRGVPDLTALDRIYKWTELIQSSPLAVERSVHAATGGAYRSQGIETAAGSATSTTSSWPPPADSTAPASSTRRCGPA